MSILILTATNDDRAIIDNSIDLLFIKWWRFGGEQGTCYYWGDLATCRNFHPNNRLLNGVSFRQRFCIQRVMATRKHDYSRQLCRCKSERGLIRNADLNRPGLFLGKRPLDRTFQGVGGWAIV